MNGLQQHIAIKDLQHSSDLNKHYAIGQPLICAHNKAGRLSAKEVVANNVLGVDQLAQHRAMSLNSFSKLHEQASSGWKIGQEIKVTV